MDGGKKIEKNINWKKYIYSKYEGQGQSFHRYFLSVCSWVWHYTKGGLCDDENGLGPYGAYSLYRVILLSLIHKSLLKIIRLETYRPTEEKGHQEVILKSVVTG